MTFEIYQWLWSHLKWFEFARPANHRGKSRLLWGIGNSLSPVFPPSSESYHRKQRSLMYFLCVCVWWCPCHALSSSYSEWWLLDDLYCVYVYLFRLIDGNMLVYLMDFIYWYQPIHLRLYLRMSMTDCCWIPRLQQTTLLLWRSPM